MQILTVLFVFVGRSSSIVDANLRVLRDRMEEVRIKERLERCCVAEQGWNYVPTYTYRRKRDEESVQFLQLIGMVGGTFGLTIFSGTFCLYIISLLVHMSLWNSYVHVQSTRIYFTAFTIRCIFPYFYFYIHSFANTIQWKKFICNEQAINLCITFIFLLLKMGGQYNS